VAKLKRRITQLGYAVRDLGDLPMDQSPSTPEAADKLKHLSEIKAACTQLAERVEEILKAGELPLVLGGDHSIAIGSLSGVSAYCRSQNESLGLIWFDAHADMNTPETTPSGNIHGMPLAVLFGRGTTELTNIAGFAPKLDPKRCVHVGARDIDRGERDLIHELGIRFITMREIDERGMNTCMDEAIGIASQSSGGYAVTFDVDALDPGDPLIPQVAAGSLSAADACIAVLDRAIIVIQKGLFAIFAPTGHQSS